MPEKAEHKQQGIRREDPPPRPVEGTANRGFLQGQDPGKHYVWVSEVNDPTFNISYYRSLGYKVAQYDPSEAQPTIGNDEFRQGDPIKSFGNVLMEIPLERKRELDERGWQEADRIQETIRNRDIEPMTAEDRQKFRGITTKRMSTDDRRTWQF